MFHKKLMEDMDVIPHNKRFGGTFNISKLGMFGIGRFLAMGRVVLQPMVVDKNDTVEVRPMMSLTLPADHRMVGGVIRVNFLADLVRAIESPELMIL